MTMEMTEKEKVEGQKVLDTIDKFFEEVKSKTFQRHMVHQLQMTLINRIKLKNTLGNYDFPEHWFLMAVSELNPEDPVYESLEKAVEGFVHTLEVYFYG